MAEDTNINAEQTGNVLYDNNIPALKQGYDQLKNAVTPFQLALLRNPKPFADVNPTLQVGLFDAMANSFIELTSALAVLGINVNQTIADILNGMLVSDGYDFKVSDVQEIGRMLGVSDFLATHQVTPEIKTALDNITNRDTLFIQALKVIQPSYERSYIVVLYANIIALVCSTMELACNKNSAFVTFLNNYLYHQYTELSHLLTDNSLNAQFSICINYLRNINTQMKNY